MKKLTAIIKPYKLQDVVTRLEKIGITKLVAEEVKGYGRRLNAASLYKVKKGMNFVLDYLPKILLYMVVEDKVFEDAVEIITEVARENEIGGGKIFIQEVEDCIDIRTGERGYCGNPK